VKRRIVVVAAAVVVAAVAGERPFADNVPNVHDAPPIRTQAHHEMDKHGDIH
jgi:hypothetical protein